MSWLETEKGLNLRTLLALSTKSLHLREECSEGKLNN